MSIPMRVFTVNIGDKMFMQYNNINHDESYIEIKLIYSILIFIIFLIGIKNVQKKFFKIKKI